MKKSTDLTFALYGTYKSGWYRFKYFFKDTRILFHRIKFLLKHGFAEPGLWESYTFFIDSWEEILRNYKDNRTGTPLVLEPLPETWNAIIERQNDEAFDKLIDSMLADLATMRLDPLDGADREGALQIRDERDAAKERFFTNFSKIFYDLWD